jgi:flagellar basal-body rod protein FlgG
MIYGLYLSATGVLTNSYRQDVIANNLANAETVGFRRSLALMQQRPTEAAAQGAMHRSDPRFESIGGGQLLAPTFVDQSMGTFESTGNNLDVASHGEGYFTVRDGNQTRLTRNGQFMVDRAGQLVMANSTGTKVLDNTGNPVVLGNVPPSQVVIRSDGTISVNELPVARLGVVNVPDKTSLRQIGKTLLSHPNVRQLGQSDSSLQSGFVETSNVDPTRELTELINAQRQLEANANMIRFQDQTLGKLVNEVGKIG